MGRRLPGEGAGWLLSRWGDVPGLFLGGGPSLTPSGQCQAASRGAALGGDTPMQCGLDLTGRADMRWRWQRR